MLLKINELMTWQHHIYLEEVLCVLSSSLHLQIAENVCGPNKRQLTLCLQRFQQTVHVRQGEANKFCFLWDLLILLVDKKTQK